MALRLRGATSGYIELKAPASAGDNTLTLPTNNGSANQLLKTDGSGNLSWTDDNSGVSLSGSTNNTIATVTGANALAGEANLTFNNSALSIINTGNLGDSFLYIKAGEAGASVIELQADEADDNNDLWRIQNAGDSKLGFRSKTSGSWVEKLGITADGHVGIGVTPSAWPTNADSIALQIGTGFAAYGRGSGDEDRGGIAVNYYNDGTNQKYIANGHSNRIYMNDGNIDFQYAPSGTAGNTFTYTSGIRMMADGKVGIGTTTPNWDFQVSGSNTTIDIEATGWAQLRLTGGSSENYITSDDNLSFYVGGSEKVFFNTDGAVGIGTDNPSGSATYKGLELNGTTGGVITFSDDDVEKWQLYGQDSHFGVYDRVNTRYNLKCLNDGHVELPSGNLKLASGKGIMFHPHDESATTNGSDSNLLDDYEEGTFLLSFIADGGQFSTLPTFSQNNCRYTKIGNTVTISAYVGWGTQGAGGSGNLNISGLPFAQNGDAVYNGAYFGWYSFSGGFNVDSILQCYIINGSTSMTLLKTSTGDTSPTYANLPHSTVVGLSGTYQLSMTYSV